ncbi:S8 family peptidase [Roseisolibacter agri]|uniref:Peptidase S8 n=1 Tax=Roseisolibacter agri TaxID=2014610 RepID=A0AA37QHU9_9BACT|nr:S8 family peptidase [Roseisolibacter agri]GLC26760.1 peptidase S8 [Roseisolibacter agri]
MSLRRWAPALLVIAACAPARGPVAPAPTPEPTPAPATPAPAPAPVAATGPAPDWHLRDPATDGVPGTGAARALRELLNGAAPRRTVVVAVIDGGVDTAHVALRPSLSTNKGEQPNNRADDDGNGYVDDVRGWNFIGGADGRNVDHERLEIARLAAGCRRGEPSRVEVACPVLQQRFDSMRTEASGLQTQYAALGAALDAAVATLASAMSVPADQVTQARVTAFRPANEAQQRAKAQFLYLATNGVTPEALKDAREAMDARVKYELNLDFDPRAIVGDTPASGRRYGNGDVTGPDASHGSHVAGIIAAARGDSGTVGIAPGVVILPVRAIPNGDERDKDVANAIRYAVDRGANIINMSFGKGYSPEKATVDSAVRYAESKGVLMVHAAGNDAEDADDHPSFPLADYTGGGRASTWIEVGASSWKGGEALAAPFSNYGQKRVDLFAPGVDILSTVPGGKYKREDGTSMAAPVVSGVAALLMAHFPTLTAADVKRILLQTVTRYADRQVTVPGGAERAAFGTLSATGGVVNAYEAVKKAMDETRTRP